MSRTGTLILLGIVNMLSPFSGLPIAIRSLITVVIGVGVLGIGLSLRKNEVQSSETGVE